MPEQTIRISIDNETVTEGNRMTFRIEIGDDAEQDITGGWALFFNGSATASDIDGDTAGLWTIEEGDDFARVRIYTDENNSVDGNRGFTFVILPNVVGADVASGSDLHAFGLIEDDDVQDLEFDIDNESTSEGRTLFFRVEIDDDAAQDVTGEWRLVFNDDASAADIDGQTSGTWTIEEGDDNSGSIRISTVEDSVFEADEQFSIVIDDIEGADVARGSDLEATGTIENDDSAEVEIDVRDQGSQEEGDAIFFRIELDQPAPARISGDWRLAYDYAATADDFIGQTSGTWTIEAGDTFTMVAVLTREDSDVEDDERFTFVIDDIDGVSVSSQSDFDDRAYINNDDDAPLPTITLHDGGGVPEGGTAGVYAKLSHAVTSDVTFKVSTYIGTANAGGSQDYAGFIGRTVTIPAGSTTADIPVSIFNDDVVEGFEEFRAVITEGSVTGATIAPADVFGGGGEVTVTITDTTPAPEAESETVADADPVPEGQGGEDIVTTSAEESAVADEAQSAPEGELVHLSVQQMQELNEILEDATAVGSGVYQGMVGFTENTARQMRDIHSGEAVLARNQYIFLNGIHDREGLTEAMRPSIEQSSFFGDWAKWAKRAGLFGEAVDVGEKIYIGYNDEDALTTVEISDISSGLLNDTVGQILGHPIGKFAGQAIAAYFYVTPKGRMEAVYVGANIVAFGLLSSAVLKLFGFDETASDVFEWTLETTLKMFDEITGDLLDIDLDGQEPYHETGTIVLGRASPDTQEKTDQIGQDNPDSSEERNDVGEETAASPGGGGGGSSAAPDPEPEAVEPVPEPQPVRASHTITVTLDESNAYSDAIMKWIATTNRDGEAFVNVGGWGSQADLLLELDLDNLLGLPDDVEITSASLELYAADKGTWNRSGSINVGRIDEDWDSTVTWATGPRVADSFLFQNRQDTGFTAVDITDYVSGWHDGSFENHGMRFSSVSTNKENNNLATIYADEEYRPVLTVEYDAFEFV